MKTGLSLAIDPIIVDFHGLHLHALMLGRNYRRGQTLLDVGLSDKEDAQNAWSDLIKECSYKKISKNYGLDITETRDRGCISYLQGYKNMSRYNNFEQLNLYVPAQMARRENLSRLIARSALTPSPYNH